MTCSFKEAVGVLNNRQSASSILFVVFNGNSVSMKATGRVSEVSAFGVSVSWEEYGLLVVPFLNATFERPAENPEFASALILRFRSGDIFALFELLPGRDFFPDTISIS